MADLPPPHGPALPLRQAGPDGDVAGGGASPRAGTIPRIAREEGLSGFTAGDFLAVMEAVTMILTLPQSAAAHVDALVVATGQGEEWRLRHAIRHWEAHPQLRHLLIANGNPAERTYVEITLDQLRGLGLRRTDGVRLQAEPATDTGRQAAWIADRVAALGITGLALTVSPYHLARVYLTVLKAFIGSGIRVPLIPLPVAVPPDTPVPETGATAYDLVPGEVQRILTYQERGWVATPAELRQYLHWLWSRHPALLDASAPGRPEGTTSTGSTGPPATASGSAGPPPA